MKKVRFKKLLAVMTAVLYMFTLMPANIAVAATSTASAYDVHIKGNFVLGQTLTAHYSYYNSAGHEENKENTVYTWYYKANNNGNYNVVQLAKKIGDNTYVITSTEIDSGKWGNLKDIFVTVSTADANGNGEPVSSGLYGQAIPDSNVTATLHSEFWAIQAHLVPKNYEGTVEVGDTLVARYTYQRRTGVAEGDTTFTWYRKDTPDGTATVIQAASTKDEYTLTNADIGKWIECTVTPYDANGAKGTAATAKIHYGNLGYLNTSQVSLTALYELKAGDNKYPTNRLLSDGTSIMNTSVTKGSYISGYGWTADGEIKYDLGEVMPLEGVFFHLMSPGGKAEYAMTEYKIEYSEDGDTWYTVKEGEAAKNTHIECALTAVADARYVRLTADQCHLSTIYEFYPISFIGAPTLTLKGDKETGIIVGETWSEPGYTVKDSFGNEVSEDKYEIDIDGEVLEDTIGDYEITYTVTYRGVELTDKRTVKVGRGKPTPGDMAFGKEVSSENADNSEALNDGNPNTLWEATDTQASAVIDLGASQPISRFVINEEGNNVSDFNIYVSSDNENWGDPVYSGAALGEADIDDITPVEGRYVKLEIADSSANAKIKDFEVHVTDDAKVYLAKEAFELTTVDTENVPDDFTLPSSGAYDTIITWSSLNEDIITVENNNASVTRTTDDQEATLRATFTLNEAEALTKDFDVFVKRTSPDGEYESTASAYDVHIKGNFMKDLSVMADYTFTPGEDGCDETSKDDAYFEWYKFADVREGESGLTKVWEGYRKDGGHIYTLDAGATNDNDWGIDTNIFVSVRTRNDNGWGDPVYSGFYGPPRDGLNTSSTNATPFVWSAHIVPGNAKGTMELGDTIAARYTYYCLDGSEGNHTFQWFVKDSINGEETDLEGETGETYTIGEEAFGKYIGCRITPGSLQSSKTGTSVTTLSHYGNLGQIKGAKVTATGVTTFTSYPINKLLSEGSSRHGAASYANLSSKSGGNREVIYDLGKQVEFDGVFFSMWPNYRTLNHKISYSTDEENWTVLYEAAEDEKLEGEQELRTQATASARYFKLEGSGEVWSVTDKVWKSGQFLTAEFYPISAMGALPTITLNGKEEMTILKGEEFTDPGYTAVDSKGNELIAVISGDTVDINSLGTYEIIYTVTYRGVDVKKTRRVTVANGVQSDGDMSFGKDVTSQNATGSDNLTDGNPYTLWETTSLPASAVIDLGEKQPLSQFVINEDGENISSYNIYVSDDGSSWDSPVYTGTSFDGTISVTPSEARYVKLEITAASGNVKIKDMEVHLDDESKLTLAKNKFKPSFSTENITETFSLPTEGEYGAVISWSVKEGSAITVTGSTATVTRGIKNEEVVLTASFKIGDLTPLTRDITVTVKGNPVIEEGVSTASAYDVHIEGNFVKGATLTGFYKYYDVAGNSENPDAAIYKWYQGKMGEAPVEIGTGKTLTITEEIVAAGKNNIFVTVQTASTENDEGVVGKPVYSRYYGGVIAANSTLSETGAPKALGAHLVPQNPEGTTNSGDVIKAYFTYQEPNLIAEGAHLYEWRTYSSLKDYEEGITVQEKSTNSSYVIKDEDFGKYIECIITPVSQDGTQGTSIKTKNSLGNLAFASGINVEFEHKPFSYSVYGHNAYETHGHFAPQLLLTDGSGNEGSASYLKSKWANAQDSYRPGVIYDMGEAKPFNGFYINIKTFTTAAEDMTFSYSLTGEEGSWTELTPFVTTVGEKEVLLDMPTEARYFKYTYRTGGSGIQISDFYPIITEEALPTLTLVGNETMYLLVGDTFTEPGYSATSAKGEILEAVVSGDTVDTSEVGTFEIIYSVTHSIYPTIKVKRTVVVDTGIPSEGDMAFRTSVTSVNANNSDALTDGNPYTLWETTALPATAVIDLGEVLPVSRFVLDEEGENISSYNIYLSSDGESWGEAIYSGNGKDVVTELSYARFVKLEITGASQNAKVKAFEVHLTGESRLYLAKEALEIEGADNLYGYTRLPDTSLYNTTVTWATSDASIIDTEGVVTRGEERKEATLTATITLAGFAPVTKDIKVSIAPFSAPRALDVHIKGNMVIGETLTCGYTFYDPEGIPEGEDKTTYQWYRGNNFANSESGKISGATGKTYTLTDEDSGYHIYVVVTAKNATDEGDISSFSAIYASPSTISVEAEPVISNQYISSVSPLQTMVAGDTIRAHYTYQERGLVKEGKTTYLWITKDSPDGAPKTVQAESTKDTYTLTADDFGKWIECIITPISESGLRGKAVTARNHYGNGFLADEAKSYTGTSWMYSQKGINAGRIYSLEEPGANSCNKTSGLSEIVYSMDAGREIDFDAIYVKAGGADQLKFEYSSDGENYTAVEIAEENRSLVGNVGKSIEFENVIRARYLKLYLTNTAKGYYDMKTFYPYITTKAGPKITVQNAEGEKIRQFQPFEDNSFTALDPYGNDAKAKVVTEGTVDTNILGDYKLNYTLSEEGYPTATASKVFNVVDGIQTEGDVAYKKQVTASSEAKALTDGNPYTLWTSAGANEDIVINLGETEGLSKIYIGEQTSNISAVSVYRSSDGERWNTVLENAALTEGSVSFDPEEAQYVKISVIASAPFTLHSIELQLDDAGKVKLAHENLTISGNLNSVTEDLALPKTGDYGVAISWESGNSKVIDSEGAITRGTSDVTVKLTATVKNDALTLTKEFTVTVKGTSSSGGGTGGSSGGGSGSGGSSGGGFGSFGGSGGGAAAPVKPVEPYKVFKDVPNSHWASEYVNILSAQSIISGKGNGTFEPEANITRAEYLKLLIETLKLTADESAEHTFTDVASGSWYEKYVKIAVALGIANGTGEGMFSPDAPILRRDMAVLAHRAVEAAGKELRKGTETELIDHHLVADYAKNSVNVLAGAGIINGNEKGEFMPDNLANRAQSAKIIYMLKEQVKE